jgi:hypothetical protein
LPLLPATLCAGTSQTPPGLGVTLHSAVVLSGRPSKLASAKTAMFASASVPLGPGFVTLIAKVSVPLPVLVSTCGAYTIAPAAPVLVFWTVVVSDV